MASKLQKVPWIVAGLIVLAWLGFRVSRGGLEGDWWVPHVIQAVVLGCGYWLGRRWGRKHGRAKL
jgi:membrane protein DedA with SNARE-associated domain